MLLDIIKKGIDNITINDLEMLYNAYNIATIRVANNELVFVQE